jgi:Barrel-sandwich domain of CusB or HlyD membrane-fusion/GAF domain
VQQQAFVESQQANRERANAPADEGAAWKSLGEAKSLEAFGQAWLTLACRTFAGLRRAALLLCGRDPAQLSPVAHWAIEPVTDDVTAFVASLQPLIAVAVERRRPALEGVGPSGPDAAADRTLVGFPLIFADELQGIVLIEAVPQDTLSARRMIRHIEWSSGWVEAFLRRTAQHQSSSLGDKAAFLIQSVETVIAECRHVDAARMFASILSHRFGCAHGAISENRRRHMRLLALSQTALFDRKSQLSKAFEAAGDEAADQATALVAPAAGEVAFVFAAQMALSKAHGGAHVLTVPLVARTDVIGALTLVREAPPFSQEDVDLIDAVGAAVAPILRDKAATDRALPVIAYDRARAFLERLFGPRHLGLKIGTAALLGAAIFLSVATDEYRVRARAEVQGEVRRVLPAPFDGYIKAQSARAGDVVGEGTVIAELQDNDLVLDRLRHVSRKRQYQFELDKALAKRDLAQINIAQAQIDQADADIELADQMLTRAQVKVPFDSVVVNGDLSQSVGRPVSRGDVLFEIAPLDRYRVTLVVPETDIRLIELGQKGELLLSAFPDQEFPLEVKSITPISRASDGVNGFEVIASLAGRDERIRPAMEGIAKIDAGRRSIFWIWTHGLASWVRIKIWSVIP